MSRNAIKPKTDMVEITKRVASLIGCPIADVKKEINFYWIDIDQLFTHCCGYAVYVERFGTFWIYTKGIYRIICDLEKRILKKLKIIKQMRELGYNGPADQIAIIIADLMTRMIFLDYSIKEYKDEVLSTYPKKYKITYEKDYKAVIDRMVQLFGIPFTEFPITINHPVQEMYMRHLRRKRILQHPVISNIKTYRGNYRKDKSPKV